jgi:hypothetical protein
MVRTLECSACARHSLRASRPQIINSHRSPTKDILFSTPNSVSDEETEAQKVEVTYQDFEPSLCLVYKS